MKNNIKGVYQPRIKDAASMEALKQGQKEIIQQKETVKEKRNKQSNYAKYVKEMYWPKVSVKKQLEMEHIITTLKHTSLKKKDDASGSEEEEAPEELPKGEYHKPWRDAMTDEQIAEVENRSSPRFDFAKERKLNRMLKGSRFASQDTRKINSIYLDESMHLEEPEPRKENYRVLGDKYLEELSRDNGKRVVNKNNAKVDSVMKNKNLSDYQKLEAVKQQATIIEERARQKEKLMKHQNSSEQYHSNVENTIAVNDMYLDAINAKLKILD